MHLSFPNPESTLVILHWARLAAKRDVRLSRPFTWAAMMTATQPDRRCSGTPHQQLRRLFISGPIHAEVCTLVVDKPR